MSRWSKLRRAVAALLAVALLVFVWLAVQVYRSKRDPENFRAWSGPFAWIVGPPARALEEAAHERMEAGLEFLEDSSRPAPERIGLYHEELRRAEALLIRSLRAQPAQARVLAALAAVRWELEPPLTPEATRKHLDLIELASRMAPTYPVVQRELGELLLKMGRRREALPYFARAIEFDPGQSREVVHLLADYLFTADQMREALPRDPMVLVHLDRPYLEESKGGEYLGLLDRAFEREPAGIDPLLIGRYGTTCLRLREPERLLAKMDAIGELSEARAEGERLRQRARAQLALGNADAAIEDARRARELEPEALHQAEHLGDVLVRAGRGSAAVTAYREALGLFARANAGGSARARLYRKIGQAEEQDGHPDRGYDAYRRALELDPDEVVARRRVTAMERAAGFE